jgi:hypothetical protein
MSLANGHAVAPGPIRERDLFHHECPFIVVSQRRGVLLCRHCGKTGLLPPRTMPAAAAAAIEGFVNAHQDCEGPGQAIALRHGRITIKA